VNGYKGKVIVRFTMQHLGSLPLNPRGRMVFYVLLMGVGSLPLTPGGEWYSMYF